MKSAHPACPRCRAFPVLAWLAGKGVRLGPAPAYLLRELFESPLAYSEVSEWADACRAGHSTTRRYFWKRGLPPAARWIVAARMLAAVREVRGNPWRSLQDTAEALGYAQHSSLAHGVRRTFGLSPRAAADLSDAELMDRWWSRQAVRRSGDAQTAGAQR